MEHELRFGLDLGRLAVLKKRVWADNEQLLRVLSSCFQGKTKVKIFQKHCSVHTKTLHKMMLKKYFIP